MNDLRAVKSSSVSRGDGAGAGAGAGALFLEARAEPTRAEPRAEPAGSVSFFLRAFFILGGPRHVAFGGRPSATSSP